MGNVTINWVIALRPEAEPIIKQLELKPLHGSGENGGFPIWESLKPSDGQVCHRLVLSGIGKTNSAAATAWVHSYDQDTSDVTAWINFGIAGHRDKAIGSVIRANRVTDAATKRSWYSPAVWQRKHDLESNSVLTVDAPSSNYYDGENLLEMEASGFYSVASRFSSLELIQSIKVVSDNKENSIETITKNSVIEFCEAAAKSIQPWLNAFADIAVEEASRIDLPPLFNDLIARIQFSETQKHQLRKKLTRHHALGTKLPESELMAMKSGREVMTALHSLASE